MGGFCDLKGQRFGRLTVLERIGTRSGCALWRCLCDCGKLVNIPSRSLRSGNTKSCGCLHSAELIMRNKKNAKHNHSDDRLYGVWHAMKQRCYNKHRKDYQNYGERGIKVCEEWKNDFTNFRKWALENGYDCHAQYMTCTIDRINVNKDYSPTNCRFVDAKIQANNRRKRKAR